MDLRAEGRLTAAAVRREENGDVDAITKEKNRESVLYNR